MLKQAVNIVNIEGILSETDLKYASYVKEGRTVECIRGTVKVLVKQVVNGVVTPMEIPVQFFSNKLTREGTLNSSYANLEDAMNKLVSIAASPSGEMSADCVYIRGELQENAFFGRDGKQYSDTRIKASFINKVEKTKCQPKADFTLEMVVANKAFKVDNEGVEVEPKVLTLKGIVPQWAGKTDVVGLVCKDPKKIDAISSIWDVNDTVKVSGNLNFTFDTIITKEEVAFGDPVEHARTVNVKELVIRSGSDAYDSEYAYDLEEIQAGLADRKVRIEQEKERSANRTRKAPAPNATKGLDDFGF